MDPFTLVMLAVLAVLVFFMFRNSRKRQKDQAELATKMVPGADVMLSFGLYGTLVSVDETANTAEVRIADGTVVTVHRQTLARVVEPTEHTDVETDIDADAEPTPLDETLGADSDDRRPGNDLGETGEGPADKR
ncbi:preprotein translocase subunit YajC [Ruicaihuangia caeni]|uniref:Preprotein translocase subunit YajC n=1 Tax=Ruicaihuangia caeni TaxID=3042517 RepID=A0AAW6T3Z7_9MICO|nr:preprotein translocase subunit YajC [Klugiella sp. YN-L-19]MDI2098049.1 preprotein translocase subunit YajC [Klugiella sp. YN-L-19]